MKIRTGRRNSCGSLRNGRSSKGRSTRSSRHGRCCALRSSWSRSDSRRSSRHACCSRRSLHLRHGCGADQRSSARSALTELHTKRMRQSEAHPLNHYP